MEECRPIENGNVILVEPNCVNINNNMINGIPQYQDMYIFAELTAKSKGRTVIINGETNTTSSKTINFIGNNQDNDDPNYLNFTTNYYDGSTGGNTHYEGFGMTDIKIIINSSYVPQVNIRFVDIRGLAFFNQNDSPYRVLFDFPPPTFTLTVKGYYGKPLTYELHLVKYTSEFSSENGNFIIDAQFVAMTFAPLADILFRYVVNAPLINNEVSMNPKAGVKPSNTFELILKLKNLYAEVSKKLETDNENIKYQNILHDIEKIDMVFETLSSFNDSDTLKSGGSPYLAIRMTDPNDGKFIFPEQNSVPQDKILSVRNLNDYNEYIKAHASSGVSRKIKERLYLLYVVGVGYTEADNTQEPPDSNPLSYYQFNTQDDINYEIPLIDYKKRLLSENVSSINIDDNDIIDPKSFLNSYYIDASEYTNEYVKYYGMDISGYYEKLYKKRTQLEEERNVLSLDIARKINAMVAEQLGMIPSIYNIFEIILNDVDTFFEKVSSTSQKATSSHRDPRNKRIIMGDNNYKDNKDEIYPFPLIVNTVGNNREERVAPIELSKKVDFPEMDLVYDFMDTFLLQNRYARQINKRVNQSDDGTYKWIPISPFDSKLGGATPESPYLGISDNVRNETLNIILKRFYMLSQGTIPEAFYTNTNTGKKNAKQNKIRSDAYLKLYAEAEAINLQSTLTSEVQAKNLKILAEKYSANIQSFYNDIASITSTYYIDDGNEVTGNLYNFSQGNPEYFLISPTSTVDGRVYVDKNNNNFEGVRITDEIIVLQDYKEESKRPVDNFKTETENSNFWGQDRSTAERFFSFTEQNLLYLKDKLNDTKQNIIDFGGETDTFTRYLSQTNYATSVKNQFSQTYQTILNDNYPDTQEIAYAEGNSSFVLIQNSEGKQLEYGANIIDIWSKQLGQYDKFIIDDITGNTTQDLSSVIILSNFGYTISPFNIYPSTLNTLVFDTPSVIEVPSYYAPYIGALITAEEDGWMDEVKDFFITGGGSKLDNRGYFVLADAHDIMAHLSVNDKEKFRAAYQTYRNNIHDEVVEGISNLYKYVHKNDNNKPKSDLTNSYEVNVYSYLLDKNKKPNDNIIGSEGLFFNTIGYLIKRESIINYSQITFQMSTSVPEYPETYTSLSALNSSGTVSIVEANNNYFIKLFSRLSTLIVDGEKELKEEEEELKKVKGDKDIINQLYYSFKNINDKWLTGTDKNKYPFNKKTNKLIDSFAFVDRGMNPIGETIINAEILGEMLEDPNITLFTVLTQLLSLNGFEFFPLQNFMTFENGGNWIDGFKIHTAGYDENQNPFFVCMYIGGSSSYPSVSGNGFDNDGIIDITEPDVAGFSGDDSGLQYEENQKQDNNNSFPFRQVRAFRVRFGEQNQSMFTNIKIDSKEYPETNESIQILSRLAGDNNPDAPVPKGQSLYNLYENRSYKATVTGFGNVMIQPTQYFQLENIPLFNGAYIILNVEHTISANKMTTSFSGTKLLKYPMPRVLTPVAFTSYDGLSGAEAITTALNVAPQAKMITPERLNDLDSVLGVDISHHNGNADWKQAKAAGVEVGFIKLTQGTKFYSGNKSGYNINKQVNDAINNNVILGYYHFAEFGKTSSPSFDGISQANWFTSKLNQFPKQTVNLPVVLDIEGGDAWQSPYNWDNKTEDLNIFIKSFIDTMTANGYETMIYSGYYFIKQHQLRNYNNSPLWLPNYMNIAAGVNPEDTEPQVPEGWWNWDIWQFTSQGIVNGVPPAGTVNARGVDLNVVKKSFLNKYRGVIT